MPDVIALLSGEILEVHDPQRCEGQRCCIHHPSDHPLRDAPLNWRRDKRIMERVCTHGLSHPDPDDVKVRSDETYQLHGCDGCCGCVPKEERA